MPTPERLLHAVREGEALARRALDPFLGSLLVLWGGVYALGFAALARDWPGTPAMWTLLVVAGFVLSFLLGARLGTGLRTPRGRLLARTWAAFGLAYAALGAAGGGLEPSTLTLAANLLVALAWMQSGFLLERPGATAAGAGFAMANALLYPAGAAVYFPALGSLGLLAAGYGIWMVRRGLR